MEEYVFYLEVWFSGHVQGVGFRYNVFQISKEFEVNGQIQNLNDGRVYLQIEAAEDQAHAFQAEIENQLECFIRDTEINSARRSPLFKGFSIY